MPVKLAQPHVYEVTDPVKNLHSVVESVIIKNDLISTPSKKETLNDSDTEKVVHKNILDPTKYDNEKEDKNIDSLNVSNKIDKSSESLPYLPNEKSNNKLQTNFQPESISLTTNSEQTKQDNCRNDLNSEFCNTKTSSDVLLENDSNVNENNMEKNFNKVEVNIDLDNQRDELNEIQSQNSGSITSRDELLPNDNELVKINVNEPFEATSKKIEIESLEPNQIILPSQRITRQSARKKNNLEFHDKQEANIAAKRQKKGKTILRLQNIKKPIETNEVLVETISNKFKTSKPADDTKEKVIETSSLQKKSTIKQSEENRQSIEVDCADTLLKLATSVIETNESQTLPNEDVVKPHCDMTYASASNIQISSSEINMTGELHNENEDSVSDIDIEKVSDDEMRLQENNSYDTPIDLTKIRTELVDNTDVKSNIREDNIFTKVNETMRVESCIKEIPSNIEMPIIKNSISNFDKTKEPPKKSWLNKERLRSELKLNENSNLCTSNIRDDNVKSNNIPNFHEVDTFIESKVSHCPNVIDASDNVANTSLNHNISKEKEDEYMTYNIEEQNQFQNIKNKDNTTEIIGIIETTQHPEDEEFNEEEYRTASWSTRWLQSEKVQKVVNSSKMLSRVRKKIQKKGKIGILQQKISTNREDASTQNTNATISTVEQPPVASSSVIGSIEEYEKIFGVKVRKSPEKKSKGGVVALGSDDSDEDSEEEALWSKIMRK